MFIDINQIGGKGLVVDDNVELDPNLLIEDDSFFLEDIDYHIEFKRESSGQIKAKGRIFTVVSLRCVYCLDNFEMKIDSKFDIVLFPINRLRLNNIALNPNDMEYIFYDGEQIDLLKILTEQVNLFIPFNPVCKPDCQGICPNCGINLNHESCNCDKTANEMNFLFSK
ncbi:MAG: DUF177 domain-containing protein [Candidatus Aminicenantes bacterium]|nr:DUF177 domain-containing protein [Candidatus Aminicenantes bacterium]